MLQLEAEGQKEGEDALEKRLAIAQQVEVGGFVSKIDRDGAVVAHRFSCFAHVSLSVIRVRTLMGHDGGNALQPQELCEGLKALPLNSMECAIFGIGTLTNSVRGEGTLALETLRYRGRL